MKILQFSVVTALALASLEAQAGELTVTPSIQFGNVSVMGPPAFNSLIVQNTGSMTQVTGLQMNGGPPCGAFAIFGPPFPLFLNSGESAFFNVSFDPDARGAFGCSILFQDNDPNTDICQLGGTGTAPQLSVVNPQFPAPLLFQDQLWDGGTPETLSVEIVNTGNASIAAFNFSSSLQTGTDFAVTGVPAFPITPNAHALVKIAFDPASTGQKEDLVAFHLDNDLPSDPTPTARLSGTGTSPVGVDPVAGPFAGLRLLGPNPVTAQTRFAFELPRAGRVTLALHDLAGRRVHTLVDRTEEAGPAEWAWSESGSPELPSGVYFVRLVFAGDTVGARRIVFLQGSR